MEENGMTDEQKQMVDIAMTSLNAYVPNLGAIRETLEWMPEVDPKTAYEHFLRSRPDDWSRLPPFDVLMGK